MTRGPRPSRAAPRAYESPLREEQADRTRERILRAFADQLAEGRGEFSIPRVAERAGVSTRAVYHHFPNRDAQIEALGAWIDEQVTSDEGPSSAADLPAYTERMYGVFFEHQALMRAQLASGVAASVRVARRRKRVMRVTKTVATVAPTPAAVRAVSALINHLTSADTAVSLLDRYGLSKRETTDVATWCVRLVADALRRGDLPQVDE